MLSDIFAFATTITFLTFVFVITLQWMKARRQAANQAPEVASMAEELMELRERVSTLERIVTDRSDDLRSKIDAL